MRRRPSSGRSEPAPVLHAVRVRKQMERVRAAAHRRWRRHPNVVGVAIGTKYERDRASALHHSVQFFVVRKWKEGKDGRARRRRAGRLPRFVHGRFADGRVDRRRRYPTDVIEVGRVRFACESGVKLRMPGEEGTITLLFRNHASEASGRTYLVSCAHVLGDPIDPTTGGSLRSPCCPGAVLAKHVIHAGPTRRRIEFDIGLAEVSAACAGRVRTAVAGQPLRGFFPRHAIQPTLPVECSLPVSQVPTAVVASYAGTVRVRLDGRPYDVGNAFLMRAAVQPGDSGGLVHRGDRALGIVFGRSSLGWAWFHSLDAAFEFLQGLSPDPIECF